MGRKNKLAISFFVENHLNLVFLYQKAPVK